MDAGKLPEMDPYKEVAQQGQAAPPSPAYVPDPMELEHHVPVYVPELVYPEYLVPYDVDIHVEDPEEDPIDYVVDVDDDEDEEEESSEDDDDEEEEHLALADPTAVVSPAVDPVPSAEETEPFKIDELLALPTPPPSPLTLLLSPLPQIPSPPLPLSSPPTHTSLTYAEEPLGYREAEIQLRAASPLPSPTPPTPLLLPSTTRRADILEADIPPQRGYYLLLSHLGLRLGRVLILLLLDSRDLLWHVGSITVLWILWMPVSELLRGGPWLP
ncbi:hypothetical protein Tco_0692124 [Tanacetum coccineum]